MKLGIPTGLLFAQYETFVTTFFRELGADVLYTGATDQETLNLGSRHCVDEACLPIKLFHGQVKRLMDQCDYVVVPRLMRCEFGEAICPKFAGLPDLVESGLEDTRLAFTQPLHLDDRDRMTRALVEDGVKLGFSQGAIRKAAALAWEAQTEKNQFARDQILGLSNPRPPDKTPVPLTRSFSLAIPITSTIPSSTWASIRNWINWAFRSSPTTPSARRRRKRNSPV